LKPRLVGESQKKPRPGWPGKSMGNLLGTARVEKKRVGGEKLRGDFRRKPSGEALTVFGKGKKGK